MSTQSPETLPSRELEYAVVDVFAERALEGNALAIFTDATGLSTDDMQSIARETNLSETTFILPRTPEMEDDRGVRVRIFTTEEELPFAGHPTLGTASWIYRNHPRLRGRRTISLDLNAGTIPVTFADPQPGELGNFGTMRQNDPIFGDTHNPLAIATALNLSPDNLYLSAGNRVQAPIQTVSTGMPFCIVPLRSLGVIEGLHIPQHTARPYLERVGAKFFFCITRAAPGSIAQWHARMQFYNGEDPATGSAAGCAIAWLVRHGLVASEERVILEQGIEMLRPSRIHLQAALDHQLESSPITNVFVGGRTIPVASGRLFLP